MSEYHHSFNGSAVRVACPLLADEVPILPFFLRVQATFPILGIYPPAISFDVRYILFLKACNSILLEDVIHG